MPDPSELDEALQGREKEQVVERLAPRALVLYEAIRTEGEHELRRPASSLAWSGVAAGLSMAFSFIAPAILQAHLPDAPWRPLVTNIGYGAGFLIAILGRQQLFTENTLTPILPLLRARDVPTLLRVFRLWAIVLLANLCGTFAAGLAAAYTSAFRPELQASFRDIAMEQLAGGAGDHFQRAIVSGCLLALLVWVLPGVEGARFSAIVALTYIVGAGGFSHVVAGSIDGAYAAAVGLVSWTKLCFGYILPVLAGNVLGGTSLVAALAHAQVAAEREASAKRE